MRRSPFGAKVRSKKPPMPVAPSQVLRTRTVLTPASAGWTVQVVTMLELASVSTSPPSGVAVTTTSWSRTRFSVAASFQCTRATVPPPPAVTR
jgi:hypothetical protein